MADHLVNYLHGASHLILTTNLFERYHYKLHVGEETEVYKV